jgi:hypothetical protein
MSVLLGLAGAAASLTLATPPAAHAEELTEDRKLYDQGRRQWELGEFAKAIDLFKQAYAIADKPAYLYNIGVQYELLKDCRNAQFFFERYIKRAEADAAEDKGKPFDPKKRAEAQSRVAKNAECAKTQPPDPTPEPDPDPTPDPNPTPGPDVGTKPGPEQPPPEGECITGDEEACGESNVPDDGLPHAIVARLGGGVGIIGAGPLNVPSQFTGALAAGYPLALGDKMRLELGVAAVFTPVPYTATNGMKGSASLTTVLANVGFTYDVTPKIGVHGALGIGAQLFSGLKELNPFTGNGAGTTGALTTLAVRTALVAEYHFTPMISAFVTPIAFTYSQPKDGLRDDITALTRIEFLAGVGFRK